MLFQAPCLYTLQPLRSGHFINKDVHFSRPKDALLYIHTCTYPSSSVGLMNHDPRMGETVSHSALASCQKECPHTAGLAHTPRGHWWSYVLHGVIDPQSSCHRATCTWRKKMSSVHVAREWKARIQELKLLYITSKNPRVRAYISPITTTVHAYVPCICHVYAMYMPCICHVYAVEPLTSKVSWI